MGLFGSKKRREDSDNLRLIARLDGKAVKYVTRRAPDETGTPVETVIGKAGRINTRDGRIVVVCNGTEVFRCAAASARCSELLSLDGVILQGQDEDGCEVCAVAYYQYYR